MGQALLPADAAGPLRTAAPTTCGSAMVAAIPGLWRGHDLARPVRPGIATGFVSLDAELPGGGWPAGALTEILHRQSGIGELRLFFPALSALARAGAPIFLLEPPWIPHAPAFLNGGIAPARLIVVRARHRPDVLWACEQILKGLNHGALLAWPGHFKAQDARRLQLAVEGKPVLAVLMRPSAATTEATPAALRIALEAARPAQGVAANTDLTGMLTLRILKRRGGMLARPILVRPPSPLFSRPTQPLANAFTTHVVDRDQPHTLDSRLHAASA